MIKFKPSPEILCDACEAPLEDAWVLWTFVTFDLHLCPGCGTRVGKGIQSNAYNIKRIRSEQGHAFIEQESNDEDS